LDRGAIAKGVQQVSDVEQTTAAPVKKDYEIAGDKLDALLAANKLSARFEFVPFSQSRNAKPKEKGAKPWRSLNWRVTFTRDGRDVLTTEYSAGEAHCPAYKNMKPGLRDTVDGRAAIDAELEGGFWVATAPGFMRHALPIYTGAAGERKRKKIEPSLRDVWASVANDSDVLDAGGFADWADSLGYDSDSMKAKAIFDTCLDIALKLRGALGDSLLAEMRELAHEL
jgi:hypothetical protein